MINELKLTTVETSKIHGLGIFAAQDIHKGTVWWKGDIQVNVLLMNKEQYLTFKNSEDNHLKPMFWKMFSTYSYYSSKLDSLILCLDNARYVNHSDNPNSGPDENLDPLVSIALRDIKKGEEITENYDLYDQCPWAKILKFDLS